MMKRTKLKVLALYASVFLFAAGSFFLAAQAIKANQTPTSVTVKLYKTELYTSATGTAVTVFDNPSGVMVDIAQNASNAFGQGTIPVGTYKRIVFTVDNSIDYVGPTPCSSGTPTVSGTQYISAAPGQTQLVFATADDGGSTAWSNNGSFALPFLIQSPVEVQGNTTTVVKLLFNIRDTLSCSSGTPDLLPPTMNAVNYVERPPVATAACSFPAQYWFMHYSVRGGVMRDQNGNIITNPNSTEILQNANVVSGWGTMTMGPHDATGKGTWTVDMSKTWEAGGMAEHRHNLASYCTGTLNGCNGDSGYFNPVSLEPGNNMTSFTANYRLGGGKLILESPGSGGYIQGAMSDDCSTFVGVDISSIDGNDLVYAVRKPTAMSGLPANTTLLMVNPEFSISYYREPATPVSGQTYTTQYMGFKTGFSVVSTNSLVDASQFEWGAQYEINPQMSGVWTAYQPSERASSTPSMDLATMLSVGLDGLITFNPAANPDPEFIGMGVSGSGIQAGEAQDKSTTWNNHRITGGFLLDSDPAPALSDLDGSWVVGILESHLSPGAGGWGTGDEQLEFGITYGELTIKNGQACGTFAYKDAMSNTMQTSDAGCSTIVAATECYAFDDATGAALPITTPAAQCIIPYTTTPGIVLPVFYVKNPTGGTDAKLALDATKKVVSIWKPISTTDTPVSAPSNTSCIGATCGNPALSSNAGLGVKIQ